MRIAREFRQHYGHHYDVVGFLDDDQAKAEQWIDGYPVLGRIEDIHTVVHTRQITMALLAIPSLDRDRRADILKAMQVSGISVRSLPSLPDILCAEAQRLVPRMEPIDHSTFLDRPAIHDTTLSMPDIHAERILVTGAAGTIGSELCRHLLALRPHTLFLLDCAETPLYMVYRELEATIAQTQSPTRLIPLFCDLTWPVGVANMMREHRPTMIFHAAAYKHVPACEWSPSMATRINLLTTVHLLALACHYRVNHFTLISTDKAVAPTTILGMTKRLAEHALFEQAASCSSTQFNAVRFGNVLGSNGSVIPLFLSQIERGGPVTITHRHITRYFMTIQEAVMLVIQAAHQPEHGTLSILDMGEPVKILDLALRLIEQRGYIGQFVESLNDFTPHHELVIPIIETGLRPGEKLQEALWDADETLIPSSHPKIFHATRRRDAPSLPVLGQFMKRIQALTDAHDNEQLTRLLRHLIPTATTAHSAKE